MSRLVHAAKHYGCRKKRYKFEMHIDKVVLTSEKRKLFTRVLWSRGKNKQKENEHFKTKWCEGVENYNMNESIFDTATIYFASNTNQIQSKQTKITLQIRERIDAKNVKFAKFAIDLSKYVDISSPHRIFYQRLNYEKARKKAQLIFTIKSMQIVSNDENISDYTENEYEDENEYENEYETNEEESHSNYNSDYETDNESVQSVLTLATINTIANANSTTLANNNNNNKKYPSPLLNSKKKPPNIANISALHSNISGNKLKNRYFNNNNADKEQSATPSSTRSNTSNVSSLTITRRNENNAIANTQEQFVRASQFQFTKHNPTSSTSNDRIMHSINSIININHNDRPQSPMTISSSTSEIDVRELQKKLKLYEDKHKKYKYKYARLCKKVEEQEIEARCQQDQICQLKRVEDEVKDQYHTMAKYKRKVRSLTREREALRKTLQKRNQTLINLNKENSKLKQQIMSLQTLDSNSVRFNSDNEINEYDNEMDDINENENDNDNNITNVILENRNHKASNGVYILTVNKNNKTNTHSNHDTEQSKELKSNKKNNATNTSIESCNTQMQQTVNKHIKNSDQITNELIQKLNSTNITNMETPKETNDGIINGETDDNNQPGPSKQIIKLAENKQKELQNNALNDIKNQWMLAETEKLNYKKLYEKERVRVSHYKCKTSSAYKKYEKSEIELSITKHEFEELQQKNKVIEQAYIKLKQDLTKIMDRYSRLEIDYDKMQNKLTYNDQCLTDDIDDSV